MRSKLLSDAGGRRVFAVVFDKGDEVTQGLARFAEQERLGASQITAIGAFSGATLGYFDRDAKDYLRIPVREQVEVLSLLGDIVDDAGEPTLHAHLVVGRRDGTTMGGHLLEAHVWPTLEVIVTETPAHLQKKYDPETGLALISIPFVGEQAPSPSPGATPLADPEVPPADVAADEVAEASWESFPASDAPGWRDHEPHGRDR
jgi:predicted DNA-binding protein with PD1-like motif